MLNRCCSRKWKLLTGLLCLLLIGCQNNSVNEKMPYIEPQYPPLQHRLRASLYYALQNGNLSSEIHMIDLDHTRSPEFGVVQHIIQGPTGNLYPVIDSDTRLNYVYIVSDTAYVDISLASQQSLTLFTKACANSLHEAFNVSYLILTVDGYMPAQAINGVELCRQQAEDGSKYIQLYYPDHRGQYIVPSMRHVAKPTDGNTAKLVLESLMDGPLNDDFAKAMDAEGITLKEIKKTEQRLNLYLDVQEQNRIDLYGYACTAMSLLRNIPGIRDVRINVNGEWIHDVPGQNAEGLFTMTSMADIEGGLVTLYFAGADGSSLVEITRSVSFKEASDPLTAIREIIRGPLDVEKSGIMNVLRPGIQTSDILSLKRDDDLAVLDLSASFYAACDGLSEEAERLLLYAIVNALTQRADIHKVLFMNEGTNVETLGGSISLNKALLRNPGLIMQP